MRVRKVVLPCYFQDDVVAPPSSMSAGLSHRVKWSHVTALGVQVEAEFVDRVTMVNYPLVPTDVSLEVSELRLSDSGVYRCEVTHGLHSNQDTANVPKPPTKREVMKPKPSEPKTREVMTQTTTTVR
uniref:Ig-like domain-containing protein n=1 Tax=Neogobius melanostomus TaxID=47308 RepID=A0A8C6T3L2_9GOBI